MKQRMGLFLDRRPNAHATHHRRNSMKTLMLYLSLAVFASLGLANAQSNQPQPAGQPPAQTPIPGSKPGTNLPPGWGGDQGRALVMEANARPAPPEVLYYFLFEHLLTLNDTAAKQEANGKGSGSYRTLYSRAAGLTDDEGGILNQVALDWKQQQDAVDAQRKTILDSRRAEPNPPKNLLTMDEFSQFGKEQEDITLAHIDELKSKLGAASFAKLDAYVKVRFHPSVAQPGHLPKRPAAPQNSGGPQ